MNVACTLLVALAVAVAAPESTGIPVVRSEVGNWSAADRRDFMDACHRLDGRDEYCSCLLEVCEHHLASLDELADTRDRVRDEEIGREARRCR